MHKNIKKYNKIVSKILLISIVFISFFHFTYLIIRGKIQGSKEHRDTKEDYENYRDNMNV